MAAKSKQRLSKIDNKLLKIDQLQLKDVICSICQSILIEPVTLPCFHDFCLSCFNGSVENNALCCPLCRLRIGSWLRTKTKQNNLINLQLWSFIQSKFSDSVRNKLNGEDNIHLPDETPAPRLCAPGEIRSEYEAELQRLKAERQLIEQKHLKETKLLIKKIQEEEDAAHRNFLEKLKQDEILAKKIQENISQDLCPNPSNVIKSHGNNSSKLKLRTNKIDSYLYRKNSSTIIVKDSPLMTDDNTSSDNSTPKFSTKCNSRASPEMVPSYSRYLKNLIDKKIRNVSGIWNKENGQNDKTVISSSTETNTNDNTKNNVKATKSVINSLPVSLPYTGVLRNKTFQNEHKNLETDSVDSMRQELCYFKPIDATTSTSYKIGAGLPVRVPSLRVEPELSEPTSQQIPKSPNRSQYLDSLCQLRKFSIPKNLPSAFVIALSLLKEKRTPIKYESKTRSNNKKNTSPNNTVSNTKKNNTPPKKMNQTSQIDGSIKLDKQPLRRTRSMGSISKSDNETTPKKAKIKERKVSSERKPYLRSDSRKDSAKKSLNGLSSISELSTNNNKIHLVRKRLSSPLDNCDFKGILEEQLRIENIIEQEKKDLEYARKMDAEWNRGRQLRRPAVKRQVTLTYALRPAKKVKV